MIVLVTDSSKSAKAIAEQLPERVETKGAVVLYARDERYIPEVRLAANLISARFLEVNRFLRWVGLLCFAIGGAPVLPLQFELVPAHRVALVKTVGTAAICAGSVFLCSLIALEGYRSKQVSSVSD